MAMSVSDLAQILFASTLQQSDRPTPEQVKQVIAAALAKTPDCVGYVAQEAGDHPDEYAARMKWALTVAGTLPPLATAA